MKMNAYLCGSMLTKISEASSGVISKCTKNGFVLNKKGYDIAVNLKQTSEDPIDCGIVMIYDHFLLLRDNRCGRDFYECVAYDNIASIYLSKDDEYKEEDDD